MKKALSLILVLVLCLSLCACGVENSNKEQKEDLFTDEEALNAISVSPLDVYEDVNANEARAKQNVYLVNGTVGKIYGDFFQTGNLHVYLDADVLATLNTGDSVVFIGQFTEVVYKEESMGGGIHTTIEIKFTKVELITVNGEGTN